MKFFDRTEEIARLRRIREESLQEARFTVVTGTATGCKMEPSGSIGLLSMEDM